MIKFFCLSVYLLCIISTAPFRDKTGKELIIAEGHMPNMTTDKNSNIHIVYGSGDSIMYVFSKDGMIFTLPSLIAVLPRLMASAMRGPQIASADKGLVVTACNNLGNIYCYKQDSPGKWTNIKRINAANESAKEALMALCAAGLNVYVVWLSVKNPKGQDVYGSKSTDGGKTWSKNMLVYTSPNSTVCECCKPSVSIKGKNVYVMFRNLIGGNRDLYLIKSTDAGNTFEKAGKLGTGSWKLNGCPMDGGGLVIDKNGTPETVWRRENKVYSASPGKPEKEIGEGRGCSIETINNKNMYAWSENGVVTILRPDGTKITLGKGSLPLMKAFSEKQVFCVWENEKRIHGAVINL